MKNKWQSIRHVRVALRQHLADTLSAVEAADNVEDPRLLKELADLAVLGRLVGVPEALVEVRAAKFRQTLELPPLE